MRGSWWRRTVAIVAVATVGVLVAAVPVAAQASEPELTATPPTGLLDGQVIPFAVSGLPGASDVDVRQCRVADDVCAVWTYFIEYPIPVPNAVPVAVDAIGAATSTIAVLRSFDDVDCVVDACVLRLCVGSDCEVADDVPLSFAVTGTYRWPTATAAFTPTTGLRDGQSSDVTGSGFSHWQGGLLLGWRALAFVQVCRAATDPDPAQDCVTFDGYGVAGAAEVSTDWFGGEAGVVTGASVAVARFLRLPGGGVDCAVVGCTVALTQGGNPVSNRTRVSWGAEWLPYPNATRFLTEGVERVARRRYSTGERAALTSALQTRTTTAGQALVDATRGPSSFTVGELVRLYLAFFGRVPDAAGLRYWVGLMDAGGASDQVARRFGSTPEFGAQYDGLSDRAVVERAYQRVLGRGGEPAGIDYWTARLGAGLPRWQLVRTFAGLSEFRGLVANQAANAQITWGVLGRLPVTDAWTARPIDTARRALASDELLARI